MNNFLTYSSYCLLGFVFQIDDQRVLYFVLLFCSCLSTGIVLALVAVVLCRLFHFSLFAGPLLYVISHVHDNLHGTRLMTKVFLVIWKKTKKEREKNCWLQLKREQRKNLKNATDWYLERVYPGIVREISKLQRNSIENDRFFMSGELIRWLMMNLFLKKCMKKISLKVHLLTSFLHYLAVTDYHESKTSIASSKIDQEMVDSSFRLHKTLNEMT